MFPKKVQWKTSLKPAGKTQLIINAVCHKAQDKTKGNAKYLKAKIIPLLGFSVIWNTIKNSILKVCESNGIRLIQNWRNGHLGPTDIFGLVSNVVYSPPRGNMSYFINS